MATQELITDAELLAMGIASNALSGIALATRDQSRRSASGVALSHLKKRYGLPLISWGDDIRRAVAHIAAYDLLVVRGFNPLAGSDVAVRDRYLEAVQWLRDVAKGLVEPIDIEDSTAAAEEHGPLVSTSEGGPRWGNYGEET
jgi:phage gp36-like protein